RLSRCCDGECCDRRESGAARYGRDGAHVLDCSDVGNGARVARATYVRRSMVLACPVGYHKSFPEASWNTVGLPEVPSSHLLCQMRVPEVLENGLDGLPARGVRDVAGRQRGRGVVPLPPEDPAEPGLFRERVVQRGGAPGLHLGVGLAAERL